MISFQRIPANLKLPLAWFEVDPSAAGGASSTAKPSLLIGHRFAAGSATPAPANTLVRISSASEAALAHGRGSILHRMAVAYRANDPFGELWTIAVTEPAGTAGTVALVVSAAATGSGTINLYIGGQLVQLPVLSGRTANQIAEDLTTAINAADDLPVSAVNTGAPSATVTLTALQTTTITNEIDVRANYRGAAGGEVYPAGVATLGITVGGVDIATTPARPVNGVTGPDVAAPWATLTALGDTEFDVVAVAWNDDTVLDALEAEWNDSTGRWSPMRPVYGHIFAAMDDTVGNCTTQGNLRNSQHTTLLGIKGCLAPTWEIAAALAGQAAVSLGNDPARPLHTLPLLGILAPKDSDRFTATERNTLLGDGITTTYAGADGVVRLDPVITTYQLDAFAQPDESMLDVTTMFTLMTLQREQKAMFTSQYGRHKLADDGTNFGPGQAIVTPSMAKGSIVGLYKAWEKRGLVENTDAFIEHLVVERNALNPKRLDVYFPPDVVNPFEVVAVRNAFRRQYVTA